MTESTKRSHPPRNPPLLISRARPVISAGRRSSRQCCCGLLCAPARINHPQVRAELLCECWSQQETAVSASLPQSPLLPPLSPTQACCGTSAAGEESQKRSGHGAEKSSCREVSKRMLRGLLVPSRSTRSRADQWALFGVLLLLPAS